MSASKIYPGGGEYPTRPKTIGGKSPFTKLLVYNYFLNLYLKKE